MNKSISAVFLIFILTGCAQTRMASLSAINGLEFSYGDKGNELIEKYTVVKNVPANNKGSIHTCAALEVNNKSVSLSDESRSFGGYFGWGRYYGFYDVNNTFSVAGGETVKYSDENSIIVEGVTDYSGSGSTMYVRYTALIRRDGNSVYYVFNNIEQAQKYTGGIINRGFKRLETWSDEHPDRAIAALDKEVEKIQNCLMSEKI